MLSLVKMLGGMLVLGRVTTANVAATQAFAEMDPAIAHFKAFLAAIAARGHIPNFFRVRTDC
jgi:hypothetical protein